MIKFSDIELELYIYTISKTIAKNKNDKRKLRSYIFKLIDVLDKLKITSNRN